MGEPAILTKPFLCARYASEVLKRRWPDAEKAMTSPADCFHYATMVLKRRWPRKERLIRQDPRAAVAYAFTFLKCRWKEAEATIASDESAASRYLPLLIKSWTPAAVKRCPMWMYSYAALHVKGRLPPSLHNRMLAAYVDDPNNIWVRRYFHSKKLQKVKTSTRAGRSRKATRSRHSRGKA